MSYGPYNDADELLLNVDMQIVGKRDEVELNFFTIIDDPEEGAPYEETGRHLFTITVEESPCAPEGTDQWRSYRHIDDLLAEFPLTPKIETMLRAGAELALKLVGME